MPRRFIAAAWLPLAALLVACSRPAPPPEPVRSVRTITVGQTSAGGSIDYAGEVRARTESRLSFRVAGKMTARPVELGDAVKAGQVLARLDPMDLRLGQEAARSGLEAARANADQAAADYKRFKELREQGFISAAELDRRETTYKAAQAQMEQARAQASVQGNQARYTSLVADATGVVTALEADPGAVLAAGAPVVRVALDGPRDVVFAVPEQQAGAMRLLEGRPATLRVRLWGGGDATLPAAVREVAAAADPVTRTFLVKADIGTPATVRLGQTATVTLAVPAAAGVFKLPLAAVFEQKGQAHVWLLDPASMTVQAQTVKVAGAEGNMVLVASGVSAGQMIVSAGVHTLTAGQKVTLYDGRSSGAGNGASASAVSR
jgi:RND family efflux transporter MFP subunit